MIGIVRTMAILMIAALLLTGCGGGPAADEPGSRTLRWERGGRWIGNAVCYGPHRDGQRPGGPGPGAGKIREDLLLMQPWWSLLRNYGADEASATTLKVIRTDKLPMRVMLGVWIAPDDAAANHGQIQRAIELAAEYRDIVVAVCVGNETQVEWSAHRSSLDSLITYVKTVRANVTQPVTVADDYNFWNKPESARLAPELDFLTVHAHPMWNGKQLDEALPWLQETLASIRALHPDARLVLGETGWATSVHTEGEQARLIKGSPGEAEQKLLFEAVRAWAAEARQPVFWFEAFDENWKGGDHPDEVEKHWGVFRADRSPKKTVR